MPGFGVVREQGSIFLACFFRFEFWVPHRGMSRERMVQYFDCCI
jgi:hypothetical protein